MEQDEVRGKGLWTTEEDNKLREYVKAKGDKDWGTMATKLDIGKTANSCRNRWRNYLRPGIRLEDFTPQEMLIILNLRFHENEEMRRWSNIAKMLQPPGRSDNHVKNFWNTQMKNEAKLLNCEVTSQDFLDKMTQILTDRIQATAAPMGDLISWSAHQEIISDYKLRGLNIYVGIGRTGNGCRQRWLNYLSPHIRLEDFTPQEMLIILNLRFHKNGWSKIAKTLPAGRSDNHVKNFWNTRMKKEAKKLNCEVTSQEFLYKMTQILTDRIQAPAHRADSMVVGGETTAATMVTNSFSTGDFSVISWSAHQELMSDYDSIPHEFWSTLPSICPL